MLISIGVLSVGLLGFALLIPVGRLSIVEAGKADRSGACGRAALREVRIRRMLRYKFNDYLSFSSNNGSNRAWYVPSAWIPNPPSDLDDVVYIPPFVIDPLGSVRIPDYRDSRSKLGHLKDASGNDLYPGIIDRISLCSLTAPNNPLNLSTAEQIFTWQDDKLFDVPANDATARARGQFLHPNNNNIMDGDPTTNAPAISAFEGKYSWFLTVVPAAAEAGMPLWQKTRFTVSVAVCYGRDFSSSGEQASRNQNTNIPPFPGGVWTGSLQLETPLADLKANQWIMLCATTNANPPVVTALQWYRVVSANPAADGTQWLTLAGPDWIAPYDKTDATTYPTAVVVTSGTGALGGVIGVYTTTADVSRDTVW